MCGGGGGGGGGETPTFRDLVGKNKFMSKNRNRIVGELVVILEKNIYSE